MGVAARWLVRMIWLLPVLGLGYGGLAHFRDGMALDRALPVPSYMIARKSVAKSVYLAAAAALGDADASDGEAAIAGAEAALDAGTPERDVAVALQRGVAADPASPRGWLVLSRAWTRIDRAKASAALAQALILAPQDYWVGGLRAERAALLWNDLDTDSRLRALSQIQLLWDEPLLRPQILALLAAPQGAALVTHSFAGRRGDLVALNRWVAAERRRIQPANRLAP